VHTNISELSNPAPTITNINDMQEVGSAPHVATHTGGELGFIAISCYRKIMLVDAITMKQYGDLKTDGLSGCMRVNGSNTRLVSTIRDHQIAPYYVAVWDVQSRELMAQIGDLNPSFQSECDINKEGDRVIAVESLVTVVVLDVHVGERLLIIQTNECCAFASIRSLAFTVDNDCCICSFHHKPSQKFDIISGESALVFGARSIVRGLVCSPDGSSYFVATETKLLAFSVLTGELAWSYAVTDICDLCCGDAELFVARNSNIVESVDMTTGTVVAQCAVRCEVTGMVYNHAANVLMIPGDKEILCMDINSGTSTAKLLLQPGMSKSFICSSPLPVVVLL
jgi:hypothetical protein